MRCPQGYSLIIDNAKCRSEVSSWKSKGFKSTNCYDTGAVGCFYDADGDNILFSTCKKIVERIPLKYVPVCERMPTGVNTEILVRNKRDKKSKKFNSSKKMKTNDGNNIKNVTLSIVTNNNDMINKKCRLINAQGRF